MTTPNIAIQREESIGIVGLGLIGGSLAKALLQNKKNVFGVDTNSPTSIEAEQDGIKIKPNILELIKMCAVVFIATPLSTYDSLGEEIASLDLENRRVLFIDVGSARAPFERFREIVRANPAARFLGSHPMVGEEYQGYRHSRSELFFGSTWILLIESDTHFEDFVTIAELILLLGAKPLTTDSRSHDTAVARVSHLSHILAGVLAKSPGLTSASLLPLCVAAGSFRDGTRVMTSEPKFVADLCIFNQKALLPVLAEAKVDLDLCIQALQKGDRTFLENFFSCAHKVRQKYLSLPSIETVAHYSVRKNEKWQSCLVELGKYGQRIIQMERSPDLVSLIIAGALVEV
jgi:prephenate dehydrogenase